MVINIHPDLLRAQDYDACLKSVCDELSARGIENFIHYNRETTGIREVEFFNPKAKLLPHINHINCTIELREHSLCE